MNNLNQRDIEKMFSKEIQQIKDKLSDKAEQLILEKIPVDTGLLKSTLEVEWVDDSLIASTDTEYDKFIRSGWVTSSGNIVDSNDYFDINLDL